MAEEEGIGKGTEQETGAETGQEGGKFRAQFSADLKDHEAFKPYKTINDLGKAHIELLGKAKELDGKSAKLTELEGKLANTIPKLPDNASDEEKEVFWASLGKPETPDGYEFPKPEDGSEPDPIISGWAKKTFHTANLNKDQASLIAGEWDKFMVSYNAAMVKLEQDDLKKEMDKLRTDLGDKYNAHREMANRFFKKVMAEDFDEKTPVNTATLLKFVMKAGIMMGEDISPPGSQGGKGSDKPGLNYKKLP